MLIGKRMTPWGCHLKVTDISKDELVEVVKPLVVKIVDVREVQVLPPESSNGVRGAYRINLSVPFKQTGNVQT